jgi:hypothetical protein
VPKGRFLKIKKEYREGDKDTGTFRRFPYLYFMTLQGMVRRKTLKFIVARLISSALFGYTSSIEKIDNNH